MKRVLYCAKIEVWPDYPECSAKEIERHEKWLVDNGYESERPE